MSKPGASETSQLAHPVVETVQEVTAKRLAKLPKFFSWRDVLDDVFLGDEDAFASAWCDGSLPFEVRRHILETLPPLLGQMLLLRRIVRQNDQLLREVSKP